MVYVDTLHFSHYWGSWYVVHISANCMYKIMCTPFCSWRGGGLVTHGHGCKDFTLSSHPDFMLLLHSKVILEISYIGIITCNIPKENSHSAS